MYFNTCIKMHVFKYMYLTNIIRFYINPLGVRNLKNSKKTQKSQKIEKSQKSYFFEFVQKTQKINIFKNPKNQQKT